MKFSVYLSGCLIVLFSVKNEMRASKSTHTPKKKKKEKLDKANGIARSMKRSNGAF